LLLQRAAWQRRWKTTARYSVSQEAPEELSQHAGDVVVVTAANWQKEVANEKLIAVECVATTVVRLLPLC